MKEYETGYFASPGRAPSRVHVRVRGQRRPLCGSGVTSAFLWCASGVEWSYVDCPRCRVSVRSIRVKVGGAS